jgi:predicted nucleotidyltransferase
MRFVQQRGTTPESIDQDALRASLQEYPLSMAVLFGSHADETAHAHSDLDVAVRFEDSVSDGQSAQLLDELTAELTRVSGFEAIDLLDLDDAPPKLGYEVLSQGTLLFGDESVAVELEGQFLLRTLDFEPVAEEWHTALAERIAEGTYGQPR